MSVSVRITPNYRPKRGHEPPYCVLRDGYTPPAGPDGQPVLDGRSFMDAVKAEGHDDGAIFRYIFDGSRRMRPVGSVCLLTDEEYNFLRNRFSTAIELHGDALPSESERVKALTEEKASVAKDLAEERARAEKAEKEASVSRTQASNMRTQLAQAREERDQAQAQCAELEAKCRELEAQIAKAKEPKPKKPPKE